MVYNRRPVNRLHPRTVDILFCLSAAVVIFLIELGTIRSPMTFDSALALTPDFLVAYSSKFSLSLQSFFTSYRYLPSLTFGLNYKLSGLDPFWFRFTNVFIHITNTCLLFFFLRSFFQALFPGTPPPRLRGWAITGALFFGLNPVAVYATLYDIQRTTLMAALFHLLCLIAFWRGLKRNKHIWFYAAVCFYFLSVHSKEHAVMLPAVLAMMVFLSGKVDRKLLKKLVVPFILFTAIAVHAILASRGVIGKLYEPNAAFSLAVLQNAHDFSPRAPLYLLSIFNEGCLFFRYIYLWIVPDVTRMAIDAAVPFPQSLWSWPATPGFALFCAYLAAGAYLFARGGRCRIIGFSMLFPAVMFMPEFSTIRFQEPFVLYRSYYWMFGLLGFIPFLFKTFSRYKIAIVIIYIAALAAAMHDRASTFTSEVSLWEDATKRIDTSRNDLPMAFRTFGNLGTGLVRAGRHHDSFEAYNTSARLNPLFCKAWAGMGASLWLDGKLEEAIPYFEKAVSVDPQYAPAYYNLGTIYSMLGRYDKAAQYLSKAIELSPAYEEAVFNLGNVFLKTDQNERAIGTFQRVVALNPKNADAFHNLGIAFFRTGNRAEALRAFKMGSSLKPGNRQAEKNVRILEHDGTFIPRTDPPRTPSIEVPR